MHFQRATIPSPPINNTDTIHIHCPTCNTNQTGEPFRGTDVESSFARLPDRVHMRQVRICIYVSWQSVEGDKQRPTEPQQPTCAHTHAQTEHVDFAVDFLLEDCLQLLVCFPFSFPLFSCPYTPSILHMGWMSLPCIRTTDADDPDQNRALPPRSFLQPPYPTTTQSSPTTQPGRCLHSNWHECCGYMWHLRFCRLPAPVCGQTKAHL